VDEIANPFAPGAGTPPPELAGREDLLHSAYVAIERIRRGKAAKSLLMIGLRGVGKTVLLDRIREIAERSGILTIRIEAPEGRSLPAMLAPQLRLTLLRISRSDRAKEKANRGLRALAGFATKLKVKYEDIEVGFDFEPEAGLADNGDLEQDLVALFETVGEAAAADDTAVVLFIDELQYIAEPELAALITALHRCAQRALPITVIGAGLPQLAGQMGRAKSYAERLFEFPVIGALSENDARRALTAPIGKASVRITDEAVDLIIQRTQCYAYFLQEWGKHSWNAAPQSPITKEDVTQGSIHAMAALDESFFRVRFDRLTPSEKRYLRAMAELGPGPHRSGDIAETLERKASQLAPTRSALITKGMIWSPNHGDTAFTVPLFDAFMLRTMPAADWRLLT
jgi:predicted transcriptional regulator